MLELIVIFSSVYLLGWIFVTILESKSGIEKIGLSFLLGSLAATYITFLLFAFSSIVFNSTLLIIFFICIWICWIIVAHYYHRSIFESLSCFLIFKKIRSFTLIEVVCCVILSILSCSILLGNWYWPIVDWDSLALYDFRAKVLAHEGSFDSGIKLGYFFHYPPYTSILHAFNYALGIGHTKLWYSLLFISYLFVFYYLLRQHTARWVALIGVVMLASTGTLLNHAIMAYTNLPYTIFISLGFLYLLAWWQCGKRSFLIIGAILVAGSTWIRLAEPFWMMAVVLILVRTYSFRRQWLLSLTCCTSIVLFKYPWLVYTASLLNNPPPSPIALYKGVDESFPAITLTLLFSQSFAVGAFLFDIFKGMIRTYSVPILLSLLSVVMNRQWQKIIYFVVLAVMIVSIYLGSIYFSFQFPEWRTIPDSALRMSMFLLPLIIYVIMLSDFWNITSFSTKTNRPRNKKK